MKRILLLMIPLIFCLEVCGQEFKKNGKNAIDLVPLGWKSEHYLGDLNKDGILDMLIIALAPNTNDEFVDLEDELTNKNRPVLVIYWGIGAGNYRLYKVYKNIVAFSSSRDNQVDFKAEITNRGTIKTSTHTWSSAGTSDAGSYGYIFRFQNGDFYKIGYFSDYFSRTTGEGLKISINYSTKKKQTIIYNQFDENFTEQESWEEIENQPLKTLGQEEL